MGGRGSGRRVEREPHYESDLTAAQIDRRFQQALRVIKARQLFRLEPYARKSEVLGTPQRVLMPGIER